MKEHRIHNDENLNNDRGGVFVCREWVDEWNRLKLRASEYSTMLQLCMNVSFTDDGRAYGHFCRRALAEMRDTTTKVYDNMVAMLKDKQTTGQHMRRRTVVTRAGAEFVSSFEGVEVPEFPVHVCRASQAPEDQRVGDMAPTGLHDVQGG